MATPLAAAVAFLLAPALAHAADEAHDPVADPWLLYLEAGADAIDGNGFLLAEPGLEYRGEDLSLALGAPLRLAVAGGDGARLGALRAEDWDESSDYGQVLRRLAYGREGEDFRVVAGSLPPATLGHGSVVAEHRSSVDPDHPRAGAQVRLGAGGAAVDAFASDVLSPRVFGGRLELPLGSWLGVPDRLSLAGTYAVDPTAQAGPTRSVDAAGRVNADQEPAQLAAVELGFVLVRGKRVAIAPYVDGATLLGSGMGLHAGTAVDFRLGQGGETVLGLRGEYRQLGEGYLPRYFDPFYEVERHAYPTVKSPAKLVSARASPEGGGLLAEARLGREGSFSAGALVEGRGHGPISAEVFADVRALAGFTVGALLARRGAFSAADLLDLEGETWLLGEARAELARNLYLFSLIAKGYHLDPALERPGPLFEASFGVGGITAF